MVTEMGPSTVRVPHVDLDDRILCGLTARQLAYAAGTAGVMWAVWRLLGALLPLGVVSAVCGLVGLVGAVLVFVRRDGVSADRLLWAALRSPRRPLVASAVPVEAAPVWMNAVGEKQRPGVLRSPARGIDEHGVVDLGPGGLAAVLEVDGLVNIGLRSAAERQQLLAAFTRALHALSGPVQILAMLAPVDVADRAQTLEERAVALPHARARDAALAHAAYLRSLGTQGDLQMRRRVVIAVAAATEQGLQRRVVETADALGSCGFALTRLGREGGLALLSGLCEPYASEMEVPR